jgi:RNA polymerase sigma-70 factor (ECF subfamily)
MAASPGPGPIEEADHLGSEDATSRSLLRRASANDPDAWQRLVSLYSPLVIHWCRQRGVPQDDLPDLVQDVFAAVASGLAAFQHNRPGGTFRGWLRGIAQHKLGDHFRRGRACAEGGSEALNRLREVPVEDDVPDLSDADNDAEVAALYRRAVEQVRIQFEERTWQAFWKVAMEDRSPSDVASELGISSNNVRQAKSRVLRRLKEELGELIA